MIDPPAHRVRLVPFFADLIGIHQGEFNRLLDVGCGELGSIWRRRWDKRYTSVDNRESVNPDYVGDACSLTMFKDNLFDVSTAWSVIEHVKCPYHMILEMRRVTTGACIITTDYTNADKNGDNSHLYSWTPKTFKQLISTIHSDNKVYVEGGMLIGVLYNCSFKEI